MIPSGIGSMRLLSVLKSQKCLESNKFSDNTVVIAAADGYFENLNKSFY